MAKRCIAFLRAINVGGHTVRMEALREHFEALGLSGVSTFIASGNVIFDGPAGGRALESRIERHLESGLGYEVATFIRTIGQLEAVAAGQPFAAADIEREGHRLFVGFLRAEPDAATRESVVALSSDTDDLRIDGRELYWLCRVPMRDTRITGALLEKRIGGPTTLRNINTVHRILAKYG